MGTASRHAGSKRTLAKPGSPPLQRAPGGHHDSPAGGEKPASAHSDSARAPLCMKTNSATTRTVPAVTFSQVGMSTAL
jgi:hypothetical protein